jgi:hypothetical protein
MYIEYNTRPLKETDAQSLQSGRTCEAGGTGVQDLNIRVILI